MLAHRRARSRSSPNELQNPAVDKRTQPREGGVASTDVTREVFSAHFVDSVPPHAIAGQLAWASFYRQHGTVMDLS